MDLDIYDPQERRETEDRLHKVIRSEPLPASEEAYGLEEEETYAEKNRDSEKIDE